MSMNEYKIESKYKRLFNHNQPPGCFIHIVFIVH